MQLSEKSTVTIFAALSGLAVTVAATVWIITALVSVQAEARQNRELLDDLRAKTVRMDGVSDARTEKIYENTTLILQRLSRIEQRLDGSRGH